MDNSGELKQTGERVVRIGRNLGKKIYIGDKSLWAIIIALLMVSGVAIYTSTISEAVANNRPHIHYLFSHIVHIGLGFGVLVITRFVPISFYKKYAFWIFGFACLVMLYVMFFAAPINGARRWLRVFGFDIQVSDYFKIALAMLLTKMAWIRRDKLNRIVLIPLKELINYNKDNNLARVSLTLRRHTIPMLLPVVIGVGLIMPENLSTSLIVGVISLAIYFNLGVRFKELMKMVLVAVTLVALMVSALSIVGSERSGTWQNRISQHFGNDEEIFDSEGNLKYGYELSNDTNQRLQSDIAIANGWMFGLGAGNSLQRAHLPLPYADFIYSIIVEEWGVLGGMFVVMLYVAFFWVTIKIARRCEDSFASMLAISLGTLFTLSAFTHIFVCIGIFPITGLTLPLISKGGSSILYAFVVFGIISKISYEQQIRESQSQKQTQMQQEVEQE